MITLLLGVSGFVCFFLIYSLGFKRGFQRGILFFNDKISRQLEREESLMQNIGGDVTVENKDSNVIKFQTLQDAIDYLTAQRH